MGHNKPEHGGRGTPPTSSATDGQGASQRLYRRSRRIRQPLSPTGAVGEVFVGGAGVTRGYLRDPELTAAKYRQDRLATARAVGKGWTRAYAMGDRGRWKADGTLVVLGRVAGDTQNQDSRHTKRTARGRTGGRDGFGGPYRESHRHATPSGDWSVSRGPCDTLAGRPGHSFRPWTNGAPPPHACMPGGRPPRLDAAGSCRSLVGRCR